MSEYFVVLAAAARLAAAPASPDVEMMCDSALCVWKSYIPGQWLSSSLDGIKVTPSGRLPL